MLCRGYIYKNPIIGKIPNIKILSLLISKFGKVQLLKNKLYKLTAIADGQRDACCVTNLG
jgi:hypothetical protein